ncbi:MAG: L-serine ammonia-lyase, iron-sulfur-dependent, subunit alpha [Oscillospiraceae bacterium]
MYKDVASLLEQAAAMGSIYKAVLADEIALLGSDENQLLGMLKNRYTVMTKCAESALDSPHSMVGNLISGQSRLQHLHGGKLVGSFLNDVMARALSCSEVNASMGLICAAPTAGACGILPAVLIEVSAGLQSTERETLEALAVAGGFGAIITRNATVSGAKGGCQAECGVAAAMAAAAAVYLAKGTALMCAQAVSLALINCMGLICDPVAGLVQLPCSFRNASQSVNAMISADMALAGQTCPIPADEVIESMYRVGCSLPHELRETSLGGIAATPTAKRITAKIFPELF